MLYTEKLLESAKAAIDEAKQHAEEIGRLSQRVQELEEQAAISEQKFRELAEAVEAERQLRLKAEEELTQIKVANSSLQDNLVKETARAMSLQHEVDRLRQKLLGQKSAEDGQASAASPEDHDRVGKLEAEVAKLRRSLEQLWNIENFKGDKEDDSGRMKRPILLASAVWVLVGSFCMWLVMTYTELFK